MWLSLKDAFLSVVHKDCKKNELMVRARMAGHIERYFPKAKVVKNAGTDYAFRAVVKRTEVAAVVTKYIMETTADNFKNSVKDRALHDAYLGCWSSMMRYQTQAAPKRKGRKSAFDLEDYKYPSNTDDDYKGMHL